MGVGDWYREKKEVQGEFDCDRISRDKYELRTKFSIGMIYQYGDENDKEAAKRMAKAHGYAIKELIEIVS